MVNDEVSQVKTKLTGSDMFSAISNDGTPLTSLTIRTGTFEDVDKVLEVIDCARSYMRKTGNFQQWINGYPGRSQILEDIERRTLFVGENENKELVMAFAFIAGDDPTYSQIEGRWLNEKPYGTIHRLASNGKYSGILARCVRFCLTMTDNIRVDTHKDNWPMLNALEKCGFNHCGVIMCQDGSPREAFQLDNSKNLQSEP